MSLVKWGFIGLLVLPAAELATFVLVASLIGWFRAAVLFVVTSVLGFLMLRHSGRRDFERLRSAVAQEGLRGLHLETPGAGTMLGGILLVLPGFITDILGGILLLGPTRRWFAGMLTRRAEAVQRRRRDEQHIIDLDPGEWRQLPDQRRSRSRRSESGASDAGSSNARSRRRST
jgi:UPF0716 protein FxsA